MFIIEYFCNGKLRMIMAMDAVLAGRVERALRSDPSVTLIIIWGPHK